MAHMKKYLLPKNGVGIERKEYHPQSPRRFLPCLLHEENIRVEPELYSNHDSFKHTIYTSAQLLRGRS